MPKVKDSSSSEIKDIITLVRGGVAETDPHMLSISDQETYRKWGESLQYSPALIEYEVMYIPYILHIYIFTFCFFFFVIINIVLCQARFCAGYGLRVGYSWLD